jgi:uncharacterized protein (DUF1501 family)
MPPITRRQFIAGAAGAGAVVAGAGYAGRSTVERILGTGTSATRARSAAPTPAAARPAGILVLVTLYGGNDGLNTVIPYADATYQSARPGLAHAASDAIHLDDALGLHPALTGLKRLWDAKQLAVVLGVGYPAPNRSHFRSMDIWQSAVPETDEPTGWLGRWLDAQTHDPMRALSLGATLPLLLQGHKAAAASIPTGQLKLPGGAAAASLLGSLETPYPGEPDLAAFVAQSGSDLIGVLHDVATILAAQPSTASPSGNLEPAGTAPTSTSVAGAGGAPNHAASASPASSAASTASPSGGELGAQLDVVSRLIKGGAPTQLYSVSLGGFDNHAAEKAAHDRLMAELDGAVSGFLAGLAGTPSADRVVVATYSEFGRRVAANASGGTDHGTAAPLFVAGPGVKGGFYGTQPSLTDLDQGDLKWSTDFRAVYATLADKVLGTDPKAVLNGKTFTAVPFL